VAIDEPGRGPVTVPIWYEYTRGGELRFVTGQSSRKGRLLAEGRRLSMCVQTETPPYQYVSVEGPVTVDAVQRDDLEMATRYLGPEIGAWYAEHNPSTAASVTVTLTPEHWRTHDFGKVLG